MANITYSETGITYNESELTYNTHDVIVSVSPLIISSSLPSAAVPDYSTYNKYGVSYNVNLPYNGENNTTVTVSPLTLSSNLPLAHINIAIHVLTLSILSILNNTAISAVRNVTVSLGLFSITSSLISPAIQVSTTANVSILPLSSSLNSPIVTVQRSARISTSLLSISVSLISPIITAFAYYDPIPKLEIEIENVVPSAFMYVDNIEGEIENVPFSITSDNTLGKIAEHGITYNEVVLTYNELNEIYGGLYGYVDIFQGKLEARQDIPAFVTL